MRAECRAAGPVAIQHKDIRFEEGFQADIIVGREVILELKSVEHVNAAQEASRGISATDRLQAAGGVMVENKKVVWWQL